MTHADQSVSRTSISPSPFAGMSDALVFVMVFGGIFILRITAATFVFLLILPQGERCPNCDAVTLRVRSRGWNTLMPWFRTSWCMECGWEGLLRFARPVVSPGTSVPDVPRQLRAPRPR